MFFRSQNLFIASKRGRARQFALSRLKNRGLGRDNRWQPANSLSIARIPDERRADLLDQGSLTRRLVERSGGNFRVELVHHGWRRPDFSERRRLRLEDRAFALVRSVRLCCKGEVWVVARSIIPATTLTGNTRYLAHLGTRPLGAALFKEPGLKRASFELACLSPELFGDFGLETDMPLWGRRSVFQINEKSILVAEIFLDNCPNLH